MRSKEKQHKHRKEGKAIEAGSSEKQYKHRQKYNKKNNQKQIYLDYYYCYIYIHTVYTSSPMECLGWGLVPDPNLPCPEQLPCGGHGKPQKRKNGMRGRPRHAKTITRFGEFIGMYIPCMDGPQGHRDPGLGRPGRLELPTRTPTHTTTPWYVAVGQNPELPGRLTWSSMHCR